MQHLDVSEMSQPKTNPAIQIKNRTKLCRNFLIGCIVLCTYFWSVIPLYSQNDLVYVDKKGVMRYKGTKKEVQGFGVNYSAPFAHVYRSAKRKGIDIKKVIDNDIYHFKRLGFDLYRVHVWDTQISDTLGNLLANEHLDTFDYLISKLKEQHINYVLTPIAYWGNGWPEPDTKSPGFSYKYGKTKALTDENVIQAQQNYLYQFLNHKNPYTKVRYKDDPNVIAFEVSNEPHHRGEGKSVTKFVKRMVSSMRKTGTKKPIFYNMSHAVHFADDYFKGGVQGGTFQWYPTGLLYGKELSGNLLPNVDDYNIPFEASFQKNKGAKLVYEFDAADVGRSYIYPAMARSFRTAGIQIATYFSYDPIFLASTNTEYNSHYMNLAYTPSKALSLKICAEIFHSMPLYKSYGSYPENTNFNDTSISYEQDLAIFNNGEKYFYTNDTEIEPSNPSGLKEIAGFGNSPLVNYNGKGAYFLDKIEQGVWRLEVMPDAIWVQDPFGQNSPEKTIAVIQWNKHPMELNLQDLGTAFSVEAVNDGNTYVPVVKDKVLQMYPGTYILSRNGVEKNWSKEDAFKGYQLKSFRAPKATVDKTYVLHKPFSEISENTQPVFKVAVVAPKKIKSVRVKGNNSAREYFDIAMTKKDAYTYQAILDTKYTKKGILEYSIVLTYADNSQRTFPADAAGDLYDWDFYNRKGYSSKIVSAKTPIYLFDALKDSKDLVRPWRKSFRLVPTKNFNEAEYQMLFDKLYYPDPENKNAQPIHDYSFKHFVIDPIQERSQDVKQKKSLFVDARSLRESPVKIQVALTLKNGASFGKVIALTSKRKVHTMLLSEFKPTKTVILPRPYPTFLPYYFENNQNETFDVKDIESIQISIGPEISKEERSKTLGIAIARIGLQ